MFYLFMYICSSPWNACICNPNTIYISTFHSSCCRVAGNVAHKITMLRPPPQHQQHQHHHQLRLLWQHQPELRMLLMMSKAAALTHCSTCWDTDSRLAPVGADTHCPTHSFSHLTLIWSVSREVTRGGCHQEWMLLITGVIRGYLLELLVMSEWGQWWGWSLSRDNLLSRSLDTGAGTQEERRPGSSVLGVGVSRWETESWSSCRRHWWSGGGARWSPDA